MEQFSTVMHLSFPLMMGKLF